MAADNSQVGVQNLKGAIELGQQALKSLELVNGGAVVAILTFYGNAVKDGARVPIDPVALRHGLNAFASGLVVAILSACFAYLAQLKVATSEPAEPGKDPIKDAAYRRNATRWSDRFLAVAILLAFASLGAFATGTWFSGKALTPRPAQTSGPTPTRIPLSTSR